MPEQLPIIVKLKRDMNVLSHELNVELPKIIEVAREHGDLRENAEYHAAKERQGQVAARIGRINERLRELAMYTYSSIPKDRVGYGSRVEIEDVDTGDSVTYDVLFAEEVEGAASAISMSSPIGQGLLNKEEGDEVVIKLPSGKRVYELISLVTIHDRTDPLPSEIEEPGAD